jgi:hypothetical protein
MNAELETGVRGRGARKTNVNKKNVKNRLRAAG